MPANVLSKAMWENRAKERLRKARRADGTTDQNVSIFPLLTIQSDINSAA